MTRSYLHTAMPACANNVEGYKTLMASQTDVVHVEAKIRGGQVTVAFAYVAGGKSERDRNNQQIWHHLAMLRGAKKDKMLLLIADFNMVLDQLRKEYWVDILQVVVITPGNQGMCKHIGGLQPDRYDSR